MGKIYKTNKSLNIDSFFHKTPEDIERGNEPRHYDKKTIESWKATTSYFHGMELKQPKLNWKKYPCCGGKGTKWVKKSALSHRKTLVKCDHSES